MKPLALLLLIALTACDDDDPYMLKTLKEADLKRLNEVARETHNPIVERDVASMLQQKEGK